MIRNRAATIGIGIFWLLVGCGKEQDNPLFKSLSSSRTGVHFSNDISTNDTLNALNFDYIYNGGGAAIGDFNNDGLQDLFFAGNMVPSKLYLNKGDLQFKDISETAGILDDGWVTGVSLVDINADGHLDIYLSLASKIREKSKNKLYINNGDLTFTEMGESYGLDDDGYSTHAGFFDYDGDGDLDVYVLTNAYESTNRNAIRAKKRQGESISTDRFYRNNGNNTFTNVSKEAGILVEGYGLGIAIADINRDGWPDVYVANDFITNDLLWINNGDGTFTDQAGTYLKHQSFNGMGVDVADFNNDGWVDIAVMDMLPPDNMRQKTMFPDINYNQFKMILSQGYAPQYVRNTLQLNNGNNTFSEIAYLAGIHETDWSWAPLFADFNNNGFKDLFITNGYRKDVTNLDFIVYNREKSVFGTRKANLEAAMDRLDGLSGAHIHNFMYRNSGGLIFEDVSENWGFGLPTYSNGAAFADLDNDGDLDLVVNNIDSPANILENGTNKKESTHYLQIKLNGKSPNKQALGAKISIYIGDKIQYYEHYLQRGYKSTVSEIVHFGLGEQPNVDSLIIRWPDGKTETKKNISANQRLVLNHEDAGSAAQKSVVWSAPSIFEEITSQFGLHYQHQTTDYADFLDQFLIPHRYSGNGPGIAVGDINGDEREDFYIGGGAGYSGYFFVQKDENFISYPLPFHPEAEDMGVLLFDSNNNGFLDLYVVSGGSMYPKGDKNYQDRLYINNGQGKFTWHENALPKMVESGSMVTAADFDGDGDLDLFIGGKVVPGAYPRPPKSFILENNSGIFTDVTEKVAPELKSLGLVSGAIWTDFNGDGEIDLVIVGEWMPITFFKNQDGKFTHVTSSTGLAQTSGWWNSIHSGDFNEDGKIDFIVGNLGLNSKYKASKEYPIYLYADDFDNNNSMDPIMTRYIDGIEYPVHPRDNLISQIPSMKRRLPRYGYYGGADINMVLEKKEREKALQLKAEYLQTAYLENGGDGKFTIKALPMAAQIAPTFGIIVNDFTGNGHDDVLLSGNNYGSDILSGWYDAGIGLLLEGDGNGGFLPIHHTLSGFFTDQDSKGMANLYGSGDNNILLVASNDGNLQAFLRENLDNIHVFTPEPTDRAAFLEMENGNTKIIEFSYGSSYLSHTSRKIAVPASTKKMTVTNYAGERRVVPLP